MASLAFYLALIPPRQQELFFNHARFNRRQEDEDSSDSEDDPWVTRGLDEDVIDGRTVEHVYRGVQSSAGAEAGSSPSPGGDEENKCMICMEEFSEGDMLRTLPCLHRYHRQCVDQWLNRASSCPICKRDVTDTSPPVVDSSQSSRVERSRVRNAFTNFAHRAWRGGRSRTTD